MPLLVLPSARRADAVATLAAAATPARLALGRTGAGAVMVARPRAMPQLLGVDSASAAKTAWVVQMLGAREIALGLGTLAALRSPDSRVARTWVAAGVLSDALDVLAVGAAVLKGRLSKPAGGAVVLTALGATLAGLNALNEDTSGV
ncbi:MAG: methionine-R-sulfoxide reductase [Frankiales bacterium]|nr:methionine-R-sulfoxide reductase [Frankiales bacterium]